ncbi:hypothetical protein KBK19_19775 [Microvirga sp. STR05]|uniref:RES domain-containing protein n=1 Tax=Hymenobacter duratus TaxID=2771356 RepID=A0ABR8JK95_9BACT|nr:hypothetical protein [Hymenobacter duratus]MBD2717289.1 hypothetical protein [Hymenobacter duratus]MBR7952209.1 hypothetical protein [Microvirga sp. STR05]
MRLISFNPAMLAAVHAGRKTVTRRRLWPELPPQQDPGRYRYHGLAEAGAVFEDLLTSTMLAPVPCPFGQPGDVLQVQEDPTLQLRIASIRAEQVRSLSEADALAEGVNSAEHEGSMRWGGVEPDPDAAGSFRWYSSPVAAFQGLLTSIYPAAWDRNEWMWVVAFNRVVHEAHLLPPGDARLLENTQHGHRVGGGGERPGSGQ